MKRLAVSTEGLNDCLGELIGTFMLVFFGCGSVAVTVLLRR